MTSQHDKPKRWRPRFSVRTLAIVVTLVCCYLGLWEATKNWGTQQVLRTESTFVTATAIAPLLIAVNEEQVNHDLFANGNSGFWTQGRRHYYVWFFGYVAKLPYDRYTSASRP